MARLVAANSTAVVDVPDELVERYTAAGWTAEKPKPTVKVTAKREEK